MPGRRIPVWRFVPAFALLAATMPLAHADGPVVGDERAVAAHLDHADIAAGRIPVEDVIQHGEMLFRARFTKADGAGRPLASGANAPTKRPVSDIPAFLRTSGPDAGSCAACHNAPRVGGAGDFAVNVFVSPQDQEYDFDTVNAEVSMERGTPHLFGAGLLELLAREMTADLRRLRDGAVTEARSTGRPVRAELVTKGVPFGALTAQPDGFLDLSELDGVDPDLMVKPFTQKAVVNSIRHFSINALTMHHGMLAEERFGQRWTGEEDFDGDGVTGELTAGDVTALVLWQATLPPPVQTIPPEPALQAAVAAGEQRFRDIGCTGCHVPALPLDSAVFTEPTSLNHAGSLRPGEGGVAALDLAEREWAAALPRDAEGRILVPLFSDLKRHRIADAETPFFANELLTHGFVPRDRFRTAPLWGGGDSGPYGHRGDVTTLREAILHHGGDAAPARRRFEALAPEDQAMIVEFLKSLRSPPETPAEPPVLVRSDSWKVVR